MSVSTSAEEGLSLQGAHVLSVPAENSLEFLEAVFDCWQSRRLFAIARSPEAVAGLGLEVAHAPAPTVSTRGWGRLSYAPHMSDEPAQIVFSSGTEGRPKAILISHRNLADVVTRLNDAMQVTSEIREYIGVPVTYSFGLGRARAVAAAGGAFFLPERFDPAEIQDMLAAGEINAISAVPSLWRVVLSNPQVLRPVGEKVRWIEIGSQYMSAADKLAMRDLFPNAAILQHYGLTEASRSTFLDVSRAPDHALESVGQGVGSVEIALSDDEGEGRAAIMIRGEHVALGLLSEDGHVQDLTDTDGWLVTRDRGEIQDGMLYYLGRLDDQINLGGLKVPSEGLEADIRAMVPVLGESFAICAVPDDLRGEGVLLALEQDVSEYSQLAKTSAVVALGKRGVASAEGALQVLEVARLPRTDTNKVQRRELVAHWQSQGHQDTEVSHQERPAQALSAAEARVADVWARVLGREHFTAASSFYDAGGDSLSSVQVGLAMEQVKLPKPVIRATLEGRPLGEVAALVSADVPSERSAPLDLTDSAMRSWAISMARAVMVLSVLLSHWGPGLFARLGIEGPAEAALAFVYRMGTPGFVAIFGVGVGYFMLPDLAQQKASVLRRTDGAFRLILVGLVMLAALGLANHIAQAEPIGGLQVANAFYGVLAYYALMMGTARWWLLPLGRLKSPIVVMAAAAPLLWLLWQGAPLILPEAQQQSLLEWPRLMLGAGGYNVFKMTAIAAGGAAIGYWFAQQRNTQRAAVMLFSAGLLGAFLSAFVMIEAYGIAEFTRRGGPFTSLAGLIFYISFAVLCIGGLLRVLPNWARLSRLTRVGLQALIVIGGLALPIYVFHGLVIPMKDLLVALGLSGALGLVLPLAAFLLVMGYLGRRLWRMYFS